jgi:hypothetical protein
MVAVRIKILWLVLISVKTCLMYGQEFPIIDTVSVNRIWDNELHNAFTDLVVYNEQLYCVFREASHHNPTDDASVVILSSPDGISWDYCSSVTSEDTSLIDIRDPHIVVTPNNELMLVCGIASIDAIYYKTIRWLSTDGINWSEPAQIGDDYFWLWDIIWYNGLAYSIASPAGHGSTINNILRLYISNNETDFTSYIDTLFYDSTYTASEASLIFTENGDVISLVRVDPLIPEPGCTNISLIGFSNPPYIDWQWEEEETRIGSPNILHLPSGNIIVAARKHLDWNYFTTNLLWLDYENINLVDVLTLPSLTTIYGNTGNADNGYPGITIFDNYLWVSYYSSHADTYALTNSDIYIAQISIDMNLSTDNKDNINTDNFNLYQNYPNPFNSVTTIPFYVEEKSIISLDIFDLKGRLIRTFLSKEYATGLHTINWDGTDENGNSIPSGLYFYSLESSNKIELKKITILK